MIRHLLRQTLNTLHAAIEADFLFSERPYGCLPPADYIDYDGPGAIRRSPFLEYRMETHPGNGDFDPV